MDRVPVIPIHRSSTLEERRWIRERRQAAVGLHEQQDVPGLFERLHVQPLCDLRCITLLSGSTTSVSNGTGGKSRCGVDQRAKNDSADRIVATFSKQPNGKESLTALLEGAELLGENVHEDLQLRVRGRGLDRRQLEEVLVEQCPATRIVERLANGWVGSINASLAQCLKIGAHDLHVISRDESELLKQPWSRYAPRIDCQFE